MSIKLSIRDGYWYVDLKASPCAAFKAHSRHANLNDAMEQMRVLALKNGVSV